MKNEIKTILFAALIAAMILPFSVMSTVDASNEDKVVNNAQKIEQFKQKALRDGEIPDSEMLDRLESKWLSKYDSSEQFERTQNAITIFVNANHQENGINQENVKNHIKIQNFDTITDSAGSGHEIVLLVAQLEKLQGKYNPGEPVLKFHEWLATKYTVPETKSEVSDRILEIVGDRKFVNLAEKSAQSFNALADNASVPTELFDEDPQYWATLLNITVCDANPECNADAIRNSYVPTDEEIEEAKRNDSRLNKVSFDMWNYILPQAFAWTQHSPNYSMVASVTLDACWYGGCSSSWSLFDSGSGTIDEDSWTTGGNLEHAYRNYNMRFIGTVCDLYTGSEVVINSVTTTPYLALALQSQDALSNTEYQNACAYTQKNITASTDWITGIQTTTSGSYYWTNP